MAREHADAERAAAFWAKVDRSGGPDACWPWLGAKSSKGYGEAWWGGKMERAHRVAWFLSTGDWPPPETPLVLHRPQVCHNPACCRFEHLYVGTPSDNARDKALDGTDPKLNRTHCPKGHPYDEANTYTRQRGGRGCRECGRLYYAAHREERLASSRASYATHREERLAYAVAYRAKKKEG